LQSIALYLQLQLAYKLPAIYNQLALCNTTTSTGIQMPAICNSFALCLQFQLAFKCPQFAIRLLFAYSFNWHINCLQFAIRCSLPTISTGIQIACKLQFICSLPTTTILQLDSRTCICFVHTQCLRKMNSEISQIMSEPSHATNCILSARHALIFMVSLYSDLVQAFENVILTIYSETHLIT